MNTRADARPLTLSWHPGRVQCGGRQDWTESGDSESPAEIR
jgi:hypothetical protein